MLPPYRGAYYNNCGQSTKRPYQAAHFIGYQAVGTHYTGPINLKAELAVQPPPSAPYKPRSLSSAHNYTLKIPWLPAEAQHGQTYNTIRTLIFLFLFLTILYLLPQVTILAEKSFNQGKAVQTCDRRSKCFL